MAYRHGLLPPLTLRRSRTTVVLLQVGRCCVAGLLLVSLLLSSCTTTAFIYVSPFSRTTTRLVIPKAKTPMTITMWDQKPATSGLQWTVLSTVRSMFAPGQQGRQNEGSTLKFVRTVDKAGYSIPPDGVVLVAGATGGVGKRVVDRLLKRNIRVRALARNKGKALALLNRGQELQTDGLLEVIIADVSKAETLQPEYFKDVVAVVACTAAIVRPKEDDSPDRNKYYQGIKFYEPEVVDTPKSVDFDGTVNTLNASIKYGNLQGKKLFGVLPHILDGWKSWTSQGDNAVGGESKSNMSLEKGVGEAPYNPDNTAAVFSGRIETRTGDEAGFASIKTSTRLDLTGYGGIRLRLKGDGSRYKFIVRDVEESDGPAWAISFDTEAGKWQDVVLPFSNMVPVAPSLSVSIDKGRPLRVDSITGFQIMLSKSEYGGQPNPRLPQDGKFSLVLSSVEAYPLVTTPKYVYVSSAGVTRPGKPGIDIDSEPPAVRMNDMLGGILTYKLKAEDAIRASGVPYTVVRPCALTEEALGAPMLVSQGDTIKGKISREDVAELCVTALFEPAAAGLTFELRSDLPFSTLVTLDPANHPPSRNYTQIFSSLQVD